MSEAGDVGELHGQVRGVADETGLEIERRPAARRIIAAFDAVGENSAIRDLGAVADEERALVVGRNLENRRLNRPGQGRYGFEIDADRLALARPGERRRIG